MQNIIISLPKAVKLNCVFFFIPEWIIYWKLFLWQNFRAHRAPAYFFFQCTALITAPVIFHISRMFHKYYSYASTDHKCKAKIKAKIKSILHWCQGFGPIRGPGVLWAIQVNSHYTFIFGEFCRQLGMDIRPKSTAKAYQTRNTLWFGLSKLTTTKFNWNFTKKSQKNSFLKFYVSWT